MSIPNRQIGWSNEANLLWYISSELEQIICQAACCTTTSTSSTSSTTTTTTTLPPCAVYSVTATVQNSYSRYIDCNTGEPAFLGPMDKDKSVLVCAIRDSVSFTFGTGTITEVISPCPTPTYRCNEYRVEGEPGWCFSCEDCSTGNLASFCVDSPSDNICARTGTFNITSGAVTVTDKGDCTTCGLYTVTTGIGGLGQIAYIDCYENDIRIVDFDTTIQVCAKVGSVVVTVGDGVITGGGSCDV